MRATRFDARDHDFRDAPRRLRQSRFCRQADGDRGSHRPRALRTQRRLRLESDRVRHDGRRAGRPRRPLRLQPRSGSTIVKRIWSEDQPFDFDGHHYKLKAVHGKPKPWWGSRPILVSAGNSETGSDFAARNADCLFTTVPPKHEDLQPKLKFFRDAAPPGQLRNIFASCHLMVRRTRKEAEDYHHYIVYEQGDWESAEYAFNLRGRGSTPGSRRRREKAEGPAHQRRGLSDRRQLRRRGGNDAAPARRGSRWIGAGDDQLRQ